MDDLQQRLGEIYKARLDELRDSCADAGLSRAGNVEFLRAQLIATSILSDWDLSWEGVQKCSNSELGELLATFGIKKSGSIKIRRQRLWLHLNHDPRQLTVDSLEGLTRDDLHALCQSLELPRSGSKAQLLGRVAGVLASQEKAWGQVKKSLRRPRSGSRLPTPPTPASPAETEQQQPSEVEVAPEEPAMIDEDAPPAVMRSSMVMPSATPQASLEELLDSVQAQVLRDAVERFVSDHSGDWSFEEESELRTSLLSSGIPINHPRVSQALDDWLQEETDSVYAGGGPASSVPIPIDVGSEQGMLEVEHRTAELESCMRDFLLIGDIDDPEEVEAFVNDIGKLGISTELSAVRSKVLSMLAEMQARIDVEKESVHLGPGSWREREGLRTFESVRPHLLANMDAVLGASEGDMVKARLDFEKLARDAGLDLRLPGVSGRLHGLFDLQVSLNESAALHDPRIARRERVARILQHGAVHLSDAGRKTLDRLEKNMAGFEQVVEAILLKEEGQFTPPQQALLIRFLVQRGYEVNTSELRPRIIACAGVVGVELGLISQSEVPPLPSGINLSDTEIDAVVAELRNVIRQFDYSPEQEDEEAEEEIQLGEAVVEASETLDRVKNRLDRADELLARLNLQD